MTAAPGDALVAPPLAVLFEGYFRTNQRAPHRPPPPSKNFNFVGQRQRQSFTFKCMGITSRRREQLNPPSHSTIALLAETSS